jgi:hypothetical protein
MSAAGTIQMRSMVEMLDGATVGGSDLIVVKNVQAKGNLTVAGISTFAGKTSMKAGLTVTGCDALMMSPVVMSSGLSVAGSSLFYDPVDFEDSVEFSNGVDFTNKGSNLRALVAPLNFMSSTLKKEMSALTMMSNSRTMLQSRVLRTLMIRVPSLKSRDTSVSSLIKTNPLISIPPLVSVTMS